MWQIREYVYSNEECSVVLNLDGTKFSTTTSMVLNFQDFFLGVDS